MSTPITAALIKELRERTGAGLSDCKKALEATAGDLAAAAEKLRMEGAAKAEKKASRTAAEGMIAVAGDGRAVALVEVNCETDFVAKGEEFRALARAAAEAALAHRPATVEALGALRVDGQTLDEKRRALVAKIGENLAFRRYEIVESAAGPLVTYVHPGDRIAVAVAMQRGEETLARDLAMHIAAMSPRYLDAASVPGEVLEAERKIIAAQVAQQQEEEAAAGKKPKPAEIVARMVDGKLRKFIEEITLHGQAFVKNEAHGMKTDEPIEKLLKAKNAAVARFVRMAVGEGIEKKQSDFAAEVMAQVGPR
ncbi:MAG: translation elongation factor Ts [Sinobacteraceae bacterium]|nr:translation elongation factor Ts [Nevskiaceae bacterium]